MLKNDRYIAHFDLDSFFVSVERLLDPKLIGQPVIVGGSSDRGVVSACSYETRVFGVRSAMPIATARKLCPQAIFINGHMSEYGKYSRMVTDIIAARAPLFEKASIDEHYVDLTGMDQFFGCLEWAKTTRQIVIKETGLPISFGLSVNKTIAKIATDEAKPNGELFIPAEKVREFLDPLPIEKMPFVGKKLAAQLYILGITTIGKMATCDPRMIKKELGDNGLFILERAKGIDNNPVEPYHERKSISTEHTFEQDISDHTYLKNIVSEMLEGLCFQLRKKNKMTACVTVKIKYPNFEVHSQQRTIQLTSSDHMILPHIHELLDQIHPTAKPIRLIGIRLSHLDYGMEQISLFDKTPEKVKLYQAMDKIKMKFGEAALKKGNTY
ncbi:MAG: DNA polymerase IV [Bacteroidota bacterium]